MLVCVSIRPSRMELYYAGLREAGYAIETLFYPFFFRVLRSFRRATCGVSVWNGGLTESTASFHDLHRVLD